MDLWQGGTLVVFGPAEAAADVAHGRVQLCDQVAYENVGGWRTVMYAAKTECEHVAQNVGLSVVGHALRTMKI